MLSKVETRSESVVISRNLTIESNFEWNICIGDKKLLSSSPPINSLPCKITSLSVLKTVIQFVNSCEICAGNPDEKFRGLISARKGKFMDASGMYTEICFGQI